MVPVHELVVLPLDGPSANLEQLQSPEEPLATVRCPCCKGLRSISHRNRNSPALCPECRKGNVVPRTRYHNYWLERFSLDEIRELGRQIWG